MRKIARRIQRAYHVIAHAPRRAWDMGRHLAGIRRFLADPAQWQARYPEEERKSRRRIYLDNILWAMRHDEVNDYYFAYGLDRKHGRHADRYMANHESRSLISRSNEKALIGSRIIDYRCLCRDKFLFGTYLAALGFPTPKVIAFFDGRQLLWVGREVTAAGLESLLEAGPLDLFCKDVLGSCGEGAFPLRVEDGRMFIGGREAGLREFEKKLPGPSILQERMTQHPRMADMHPASLNTFRLVTVLHEGKARPFASFMRCGTEGRAVDNWSAGGIGIAVDLASGRLGRRGFFAPGKGGSTFSQPETGFVFDGFQIPFWKEAVELAKRLHPYFYGLGSIGWDIAVTRDGPTFIEGNHWWDTRSIQAIVGGLKDSLPKEIRLPRSDSQGAMDRP